MPTIFESEANYQRVVNVWTRYPVSVRLEGNGRFSITSLEDQSVILDSTLAQIQRVYDYFDAIVVTVEGKQYKLNFSKPVSFGLSIIFGGIYNWIAPRVNNPLAGVKSQWIKVFEQQGMEITKAANIQVSRIVIAVAVAFPVIIIAIIALSTLGQ